MFYNCGVVDANVRLENGNFDAKRTTVIKRNFFK